jgi:hypothetical protein
MKDGEPTMSLARLLTRPVTRGRMLGAAAGLTGGLVAGAGLTTAFASGSSDNTSGDTPQQIFTAALIAEDLATTFYYNGLIGPVIQDPALAGHNGTATDPSPNPRMSNPGNINYLQAALSEEIDHATLLRSLIDGSSPATDPYQTFYFPAGSFATLTAFTGLLDALENAFIGAYLAAIGELAAMAADTKAGITSYTDATGTAYTSIQLEYFARVAASILGVESEHRVLGRVISNSNPANNLCYEQMDGITTVYNGTTSAVAALTPFLTSTTGPGYSLQTALAGASAVSLPCSGNPPSM